MILDLIHRIKRKLMKLRLQPIQVYCLHHVTAKYDPLRMWKSDWIEIETFKQKVQNLRKNGVEFISITEAYRHICEDKIRSKKYAVLAFDDGYASIKEILPWLEEQKFPITLFVNTKYLDGKSWSEINEEQAKRAKPNVDMVKDVCPNLYLCKEDLISIAAIPNITIGMHGHEHLDATQQTNEEFKENINKCQETLKEIPHTISYFAYPWGRHNERTDEVLKEKGLIPVLVSGMGNYNNKLYIDRDMIDK